MIINYNSDVKDCLLAIPNAVGDGLADDTLALREYFVDRMSKGKIIYIPEGIYGVKPTAENEPILPVPGSPTYRQTITGPGEIKVLDNAGNYESIIGFQAPHNAPSVTGLTIDHNSQNNILPDLNAYKIQGRYSATTYKSGGAYKSAKFNNNTVKNSDSVVSVYFAFVQGNGDAEVMFNHFLNCRNANGTDYDQSFVNFTSASGRVIGNRFEGESWDVTPRTAIELHGSNIIVSENFVDKFQIGLNSSGIHQDNDELPNKSSYVINNVLNVSRDGIMIWGQSHSENDPIPESAIENFFIENNSIRMYWKEHKFDNANAGIRGISLFGGQTAVNCSGIKIRNNHIWYEKELPEEPALLTKCGSRFGALGYYFGASNAQTVILTNLDIRDNTVENCPVSGLYCHFGQLDGADFSGNTFIDCAQTQHPGVEAHTTTPMYINVALLDELNISKTTIHFTGDIVTSPDFVWFRNTNTSVLNLRANDMRFKFKPSADISQVNDYLGVANSAGQTISFNCELPTTAIRLPAVQNSLGCRVRFASGEIAEKIGSGYNHWRITSYGGTTQTPTTTGRRRGDLIIVQNPDASGFGAWIATANDDWKQTWEIST